MSAEFIFIFALDPFNGILMALLAGSGFAFASGAVEALVYDSLPSSSKVNRDEAMKRAMGRVNSWGQIAFVIAPIIGGLIIGDARVENFIPAIVLTVAALLVGTLVCLTLREPTADSSEARTSSLTLLRDGVHLLRHHQRLRRLAMLVIFTTPITSSLITTLGPPYLTQNEASPFMAGVVLSVGSLLAAFTQRYAYKLEEWLGQASAIAVLILLPGLTYWLLAAVAGPAATVLVMILIYGVNDMKAPLFSAYQNALIESKNRATVLSLIQYVPESLRCYRLPDLRLHRRDLTRQRIPGDGSDDNHGRVAPAGASLAGCNTTISHLTMTTNHSKSYTPRLLYSAPLGFNSLS